MDIRPLPEEIPYVLAKHHTTLRKPNPEYPASIEGLTEDQLLQLPPAELEEQGPPIEGSPRFIYKPLNPRERAKWATRLYNDDVDIGTRNDRYIDLFIERVVRIEDLTVGEEPFNMSKHLNSLELGWLIEVGMVIFTKSKLSEEDAGK